MNIQYLTTALQPRALVWCKSSELTDNNDGTYTVNDSALAATLGTGSEIIVIDIPGKFLFYDAATQLAHDWTATGA